MIKYLVFEECQSLNFFPVKHGISKQYSPMTIVEHRVLDYKKHCMHPFGSFVQAKDETNPLNSMALRTMDCIYLRPVLDNVQGGHELLNLATKRVVTRMTVIEIPIPDRIIKLVEELAKRDGIKSFKFVSCSIAGVDELLQKQIDLENLEDEEDEDYDYEQEDDIEFVYDKEERLDDAELDELAGVDVENHEANVQEVPE